MEPGIPGDMLIPVLGQGKYMSLQQLTTSQSKEVFRKQWGRVKRSGIWAAKRWYRSCTHVWHHLPWTPTGGHAWLLPLQRSWDWKGQAGRCWKGCEQGGLPGWMDGLQLLSFPLLKWRSQAGLKVRSQQLPTEDGSAASAARAPEWAGAHPTEGF